MSNSTILDIFAVVILSYGILSGARQGFVMSLWRLVGSAAALFGAIICTDRFAPEISRRFVFPAVESALQGILPGLAGIDSPTQLQEAVGMSKQILSQMLEQMGFAGIGLSNAAEELADALLSGSDIAAILSLRLAQVLTFSAAFFLIQIISSFAVRLLSNAFCLPVMGAANRTAGAVLGFLKSAVVLILVFWAGVTFLSFLTEDTAILAPATIEKTIFAKEFIGLSRRFLP
jgi:uncharacterized membrane protein required for colicin V production